MSKPRAILGISAFYHDSAAALVVDGRLVAAAQEERFTRQKHDARFPISAISYCLQHADLRVDELTAVVYYDKPLLKFERLLETVHAFAPAGLGSFLQAMPVWIKDKLFIKRLIRRELSALGALRAPVLFTEHHLAHAASAFFASPFDRAAILTIDGVGEWATASLGQGNGNQLTLLRELHFPHSVGLLYSAFTFYLGFRVNSGEYKLMGLAPYGDEQDEQTITFREKITSELVDIRPDGSLLLNLRYFRFTTGQQMTDDRRWMQLFGLPRRLPEAALTSAHTNLALAIQQVTEEIVLRMAQTARTLTQLPNLVMAGGVALNCVANGHLWRAGVFDRIWVQPAAGDAGGALGAALAGWYIHHGAPRLPVNGQDAMQGAYLGPEFSEQYIGNALRRLAAAFEHFEAIDALLVHVAQALADGKVVGWFQGRAEFGPRALGNRSILADPRRTDMQQRLNAQIKFREDFRPFAPAVLAEAATEYFDFPASSPYMLFTAPVQPTRRQSPLPHSANLLDRLYHPRSDIPAVTHLDYSARLQTVHRETNPLFWQLLRQFWQLTGCAVLVNTSFNVRGEPMVGTPEEAYQGFMRTDMDALVVGNYWLEKDSQPPFTPDEKLSASFVASD